MGPDGLDGCDAGGFQVDRQGLLANWMVPGQIVPVMGGAMDLVSRAKRIVVAMTHTQKGVPKIVEALTLPATAIRPVTLIVTKLAVIEPTPAGFVRRETAPGVSVIAVRAGTAAASLIADNSTIWLSDHFASSTLRSLAEPPPNVSNGSKSYATKRQISATNSPTNRQQASEADRSDSLILSVALPPRVNDPTVDRSNHRWTPREGPQQP